MRDEPVRCVCRRKAMARVAVDGNRIRWAVMCNRIGCWQGPMRRSRTEAVRAWNRLMKRKGGGRDEVRDNRMRK